MKSKRVSGSVDIKVLLKQMEVSSEGISIMKNKSEVMLFYISDMSLPAANILKQDALSLGAELAVPYFAILCKRELTDGVLICNKKQLKLLVKKERLQPFGLKELALELEMHTKEAPKREIKIMGVINANEDSFYHKSRFLGDKALEKIDEMISVGAKIIDIGGVSSRPGSGSVSLAEEIRRVSPILKEIKECELYKKAVFSIDTYRPKVAELALQCGFKIINDITGLESDELAHIAGEAGASVVIMHKKGTPKDMQKEPKYDDVVLEVAQFFEERIGKAQKHGIKEIFLDIGIGFGKSLEHNLLLLKHLAHFKKFGCELLVGASRKSMIDKLHPSGIDDRLAGTITLHLEAIKNGATIIRAHDVREHLQAVAIHEALSKVTV